VTTREGEAMTTFGGPARRMDRACQWQGLNRQLHNQVVNGIYLTLAAPEYGTRGERLWALLDDLSGLRTAPTAPHDS
jgi:hypothetical protein